MTDPSLNSQPSDLEEAASALVVFTPSGKRGRFALGTPLLVAARQLGVDLDTVCGGRGICGRCQVTPQIGQFAKHGVSVAPEHLSAWNKVEERYKSKRSLLDGRRLGCQATVQGDLVIDIPPESQVHAQVVRKEAAARDIPLDPATRLYTIRVDEPDMHAPTGDLERLIAALSAQHGLKGLHAPLSLLARLQGALRKGGWQVTVAVSSPMDGAGEIVEIWPGEAAPTLLGLAIDIGSTTIAGHLVDLTSGAVLASAGLMNPQIRFGEDLMSRVSYSMMHEEGAAQMSAAVREAVDTLAGTLCAQADQPREAVFEAVVVGNPVMHHLFLGLDPVELGGAPFALVTSAAGNWAAKDLGLALHRHAKLYTLPCIAGHVGADAAAATLAEAPQDQGGLSLLVDVGTNAEIVLADNEQVLACSSPTGPAFEGAQISGGQRAAPGAIERVRIDPNTHEPRFSIIGCPVWSDEPGFAESSAQTGVTGICGSGIIEVIAEMRLAGVLDEDGVIIASPSPRVFEDGRTRSYLLHDASPEGPRIVITQNDVRAIQLAKAALYAGCKLLMEKRGVTSVDRVLLAGAFGAHISPLHAMILGMIPDCEIDQVRAVGNAAGTGARIALLNRSQRREIEAQVARIEKIETAVEPRFQEIFVEAMALPNKRDPFPKLAEIVSLPKIETKDQTGRRRARRR
ncbi:MAG: ASKHA domain-containing protein [Neomegalonema sp.]|nr:ASKHA domain-containing protein [Neomegalonema sp.]